ncbi:hypothetical protein [Zooshikella ganghwensis]|uniref:hypothetical protein n=1 Tax=Zooshikella ganghwensis TaxID=202772 RepID=UPI00197D3CE9|nr:hypothetical protein [Zooshikella ganghwensis]
MPNFKKYNYDQTAMIVINFEEQLQPNIFEFTLHQLIDHHIDLLVFHEKCANDTGGRSAYTPSILLKIILFSKAYSGKNRHLPTTLDANSYRIYNEVSFYVRVAIIICLNEKSLNWVKACIYQPR